MDYKILMDVSGELLPDYIREHEILFLPMEYTLRGENRVCREPEDRGTLKLFYDGQRQGDLTQTTQITPTQYEEFFESVLKNGSQLICLCLSSGLSSTYQSACLAASTLQEKYQGKKILPVDTLAATGGMGVLAERAVRNLEKGMDIEENYRDLVEASHHIQHQFFVQDLMYLRRGGRIGTAEAILGSALSVRPIMKIDTDGKLVVTDKKRGTKQAIQALFAEFEKHYDEEAADPVYITDCDIEDSSETLSGMILAKYPGAPVRRVGMSPIIGAHTGPGALTVCYMGK